MTAVLSSSANAFWKLARLTEERTYGYDYSLPSQVFGEWEDEIREQSPETYPMTDDIFAPYDLISKGWAQDKAQVTFFHIVEELLGEIEMDYDNEEAPLPEDQVVVLSTRGSNRIELRKPISAVIEAVLEYCVARKTIGFTLDC